MASNFVIPDNYKDLTPGPQLDKKTLNKMIWRSLFLQASFNYERMQAAGWLYGILPGLEKIHSDKEDLAASMSHNLEFFNVHPFLVTFAMGIVLSLEQNKVDIPTIRAVRVAMMGPLGGIGDAIFWLTLVPIAAGITSQMAIQGNAFAPFLFLIIFNVVQFAVRYYLMYWSYNTGTGAIDMLTKNGRAFSRAASILGVFVVGCLIVTMGTGVKLGVQIPNGSAEAYVAHTATVLTKDTAQFDKKVYQYDKDGNMALKDGKPVVLATTDAAGNPVKAGYEKIGDGTYSNVTYMEIVKNPVNIDLQKVLDTICPHLLPFAITMLLYYLLTKHRFTPLRCILLILVIALLGAGFGLWPSIWG